MLKDYESLFPNQSSPIPLSPFDNLPHETPKQHFFAEEMLDWLKHVPRKKIEALTASASSSSSSSSSSSAAAIENAPLPARDANISALTLGFANLTLVPSGGPRPQVAFNPSLFALAGAIRNPIYRDIVNSSKLKAYKICASEALSIWKLQDERKRTKKQSADLVTLWKEAQEMIARGADVVINREKEREERFDKCIAEVKEINDVRFNVQEDRNQNLQVRLERTQNDVEQEKKINLSHQNTIRIFQRLCADLQGENANLRHDLHLPKAQVHEG